MRTAIRSAGVASRPTRSSSTGRLSGLPSCPRTSIIATRSGAGTSGSVASSRALRYAGRLPSRIANRTRDVLGAGRSQSRSEGPDERGGTASRRRPSSPFSIPATRRSTSRGPGAASKSRAQALKSSGSPRAASNRADALQQGLAHQRRSLRVGRGDQVHRPVAVVPHLPLEGPPDQEGDVRVGGVLGPTHQPGQDRQGLLRVPALAARRELAPHEAVGLVLGEVHQAGQEARAHPVLVAQEPDGPPPHAGDGVVEQAEGRRVVEASADVQRPEVAQRPRPRRARPGATP